MTASEPTSSLQMHGAGGTRRYARSRQGLPRSTQPAKVASPPLDEVGGPSAARCRAAARSGALQPGLPVQVAGHATLAHNAGDSARPTWCTHPLKSAVVDEKILSAQNNLTNRQRHVE